MSWARDIRRRLAARDCTYMCESPDHGHPDVRRAAWAFAREVERRAGDLVDLTWWRKDRDPGSVFVDYNQNARDHTIASAYPYAAPWKVSSRRRFTGPRSLMLIPRTSPSPPCRPASPMLEIFMPISTTTPIGSISCWRRIGTSATTRSHRLMPSNWSYPNRNLPGGARRDPCS